MSTARKIPDANGEVWLKAIRLEEGDGHLWMALPRWQVTLWSRAQRRSGSLAGRPSWTVGADIGIYVPTFYSAPMLVRVDGDVEIGRVGSGDVFFTPAVVTARVALDRAAGLGTIGLDPSKLGRRDRLRLDGVQGDRLTKHLADRDPQNVL